MSLSSVTGKNWISKEFNSEEIDFFKTNYFVDEIVAKLLSIRKIKKEEIVRIPQKKVIVDMLSMSMMRQSRHLTIFEIKLNILF